MQFTFQNTMLVSTGYIETIHCTYWWLNQVTCRRNGLIWHLWKLFSCVIWHWFPFPNEHFSMFCALCYPKPLYKFSHKISFPLHGFIVFDKISIIIIFCIPYLDTLAVELSSWDWQALLGRWPQLHEANNITSNFNKECHLSSLTN